LQLANSYKLESQESIIVDTTQYNSRACVTSGPESCLDLVSWPRLETALFPDLVIDTVSYSTARSKTCSKETENLYPRVWSGLHLAPFAYISVRYGQSHSCWKSSAFARSLLLHGSQIML